MFHDNLSVGNHKNFFEQQYCPILHLFYGERYFRQFILREAIRCKYSIIAMVQTFNQ